MLRQHHITSMLCGGNGSLKKGIKEATASNLRFVVLLGESEMELFKQSRIVVKDLLTREQKDYSLDDFIHLVSWLVLLETRISSYFGNPLVWENSLVSNNQCPRLSHPS